MIPFSKLFRIRIELAIFDPKHIETYPVVIISILKLVAHIETN